MKVRRARIPSIALVLAVFLLVSPAWADEGMTLEDVARLQSVTQVAIAPSGGPDRAGFGLAYDPLRDRIVLFGGREIATDRDDLDSQIYKTFAGCGVVDHDRDPCRAASGEHLSELLTQQKTDDSAGGG